MLASWIVHKLNDLFNFCWKLFYQFPPNQKSIGKYSDTLEGGALLILLMPNNITKVAFHSRKKKKKSWALSPSETIDMQNCYLDQSLQFPLMFPLYRHWNWSHGQNKLNVLSTCLLKLPPLSSSAYQRTMQYRILFKICCLFWIHFKW